MAGRAVAPPGDVKSQLGSISNRKLAANVLQL
jgi:hypothetical protein